jgi:DNA polymerase I
MPERKKVTKKLNRYILIDGNALVHRGFHAIPGLTTKTGEPTGAVYGFAMILLKAVKDLKPTHIAVSFDLAGPTFRHEQYADYKATRVKAAQELYDQIPRVKEVVRALNIPIFEKEGFEADDVLGTLARHLCEKHGDICDVMIVSGDLDMLQLVNKCVKIYTLRKGISDTAVYDESAIQERYGLKPAQMIDYKALRGDPSDNIKGVKGIGEKGAADLIQEFGSIDNLYKNIHKKTAAAGKIKLRTLELLITGEDSARQSYQLSKIVTDAPFHIDVPPYEFTRANLSQTIKLFQDLEFKSLVDKLPKNYIGMKDESVGVLSPPTPAARSAALTSSGVPREAPPLPADIKQDYQLVDTEKKLITLLKKLDKQKEFALDTETTSLDAISADLVGVSLSFKDGEAYYLPADVVAKSAELKNIIEDAKAKKIGHNIKYDLLSLQNAGIKLDGIYFDTMVASYLLNAGTRQHNLATLAFNELGYQMQPIEELIGKGKKQITMDQVPVEKVSWYAAEDADITWRLKRIFEPELKQQKLDTIFRDIEMPLIEVLAGVERWGIKLDAKLLNRLSQDAEKQIYALEKDIYKLADREFNLNSPKQLQEVLFQELQLTTGKKIKTGTSTAASELERLVGEHPIVGKIMSYRELSKLQSTYLQTLPLLVNKKTGRIHTSYNQTIAATGRLSSVDPNLQNIPVRGSGIGAEIRKAFIAEQGYKLVSFDYSQIELRIVAHLADDKTMKKIFKNDEDIHTNTAMAIFGVPPDKVTPDMRRDAKTINFGVLYGLSSFGLSSRIGAVSRGEAKEFIDKYFAAYPKVKAYIEDVRAQVNEDGYVKNELGRTRKFPEIKSSQFFIRAAAERAAINFPIQSLAADVIKVAMINIAKELAGQDGDIRMLLQVHDELVFEVKEGKIEEYVKKIKPLMEEAIQLSVPVKVEAKVGDNWGEMEKIKK